VLIGIEGNMEKDARARCHSSTGPASKEVKILYTLMGVLMFFTWYSPKVSYSNPSLLAI